MLLFVAQGLTGCIITFLLLFSSHPAVGSNWLALLFNPVPLVLFPWFMKAAANGRRSWVMYIQIAMVVMALIVGIAGLQHFPNEVYIIASILLVRVATHFCMTNKGK